MKKLLNHCNSLLQNSVLIQPSRKFSLLMALIGGVHIFYVGFFLLLHMPVLYVYNLLSVVFYLLCAGVKNRERYSLAYTGSFVEINFHALLTSVLLPCDCGFITFCVIIAPISFYMAFSLSVFRRNILTPSMYTILSAAVFVLCHLTRQIVPPYYPHMAVAPMLALFFVNSFVTFFTLLGTSLMFIYEMHYQQSVLRNKNRYLDTLASLDPLTMLLNRRRMQEYMNDAYQEAAAHGTPFCLVLCDIDDFKHINDTYGHACGDQVLIHISEIIRSNVRKDDHVCRWGGEEILLLIHSGAAETLEIAERIRKEVAEIPTYSQNHRVSHTLTLGIAPYEKDVPLDTIIRLADSRLYTGKRKGKNVVVS